MAKSLDERIAEAEESARKLRAKKADKERREDTRRKVLAGALLLHLAEQKGQAGEAARTLLRAHLADFLKRPDDRALFTRIAAPAVVSDITSTGDSTTNARLEAPHNHETF